MVKWLRLPTRESTPPTPRPRPHRGDAVRAEIEIPRNTWSAATSAEMCNSWLAGMSNERLDKSVQRINVKPGSRL